MKKVREVITYKDYFDVFFQRADTKSKRQDY